MVGGDDLNAVGELAHGPVFDRHTAVTDLSATAVVEPAIHDPGVATTVPRARVAVAVQNVTVQVQGDVVGTDHDAVTGAVDQVRVERRVLRDHVAAVDVTRECLAAAHEKRR